MLKPQGYGLILDPDAPNGVGGEYDTAQCGHCQAIIFTKPGSAATTYLIPIPKTPGRWREAPGAFCRVCMRPVCLRCDGHGRCTPWERALARSEARDRLRRAAGRS